MEEDYRYPVFFQCRAPLNREQRSAIEKHFSLRRRSGGGDCGPVTGGVRDRVFSVAFMSHGVQQRVLQRAEHVVECAGESLELSVRSSPEPDGATPPTTSSSLGPAAAGASLHSTPDSSPPPSGEECELRPDAYLLRYLQECPQAREELETQLSSVDCTAQLFPEEGSIVVRRPAQAGAGEERRRRRSLKAEADELFDGYRCHFELDPLKVKALLQPRGGGHTPEGVRVFGEAGMAVVVGKHSPVSARLTEVEDSTVKGRRSRSAEQRTSTHRLGEAKLRLLWTEIEAGVRQKFPGVEVRRGEAGQVVLEGPAGDLLEAGDWISGRESLVLERRVSTMSSHLLALVRKAYGGPGELRDLLGVGAEVEPELGDTELRFFSLSAEKLDDPANKMQEMFQEIKIDLPVGSAVPSDLQEKLRSKVTELNRGQRRAQVLFGSDSTVFLLGRSEAVEQLTETVVQCFLPNSIHLPFPQLAQELQDFLQLHGSDLSDVTFRPLTLSSRCLLVLDGPPGQVAAVRNLLGPFLKALVQDTAELTSSLNLSEGNPAVAGSSLCDVLQVLVCREARVGPENSGPEGQRRRDVSVEQVWKVPAGDAVATTGGDPADGGGRFLLQQAALFTLNVAERMELGSVAMPRISSGIFSVPVDACAEALVAAVKEFGSQGGRSLNTIILIDPRAQVVRALQEACDRLLRGAGLRPPPGFQVDAAGAAVNVEIVQGTVESQQVDALVSPMVGHDPLSTSIGDALSNLVGPESDLIPRFINGGGEDSLPGDAVLVEGVSGLPSKAVFFLNLVPWDDDEDGTAVQVLRLGVNNILTSCESRGFGSVALPVLGVGGALRFPHSVVSRVLLEEVCGFKPSQTSTAPLLVRITVHPTDTEATEAFRRLVKETPPPDPVTETTRIILLGKTGSGKSALANTLFGAEELFRTSGSSSSGTDQCQAETRAVNGRSITLIDTPGLFDTDRSEEELKPQVVSCMVESTPGPHVFLIVLKVERFTEQEQATVANILKYFSADALKYAVIVFTHGNQLLDGRTIQDFVRQNKNLSDVVRRCGGRCHVFDNSCWNDNDEPKSRYRSNRFQTEELLNTIDEMMVENDGGCYTNDTLQEVDNMKKMEEWLLQQSSKKRARAVVRQQAKASVKRRLLIKLSAVAAGLVLGAVFGAALLAEVDITSVKDSSELHKLNSLRFAKGMVSTVIGGKWNWLLAGAMMAGGAAAGGVVGYNAAEEADSPMEAVEMALNAVIDQSKVMKLK